MFVCKSRLFVVVLLALVSAAEGVAQADFERKTGRLRDGRAFRTDSSGNQLVDELAELQVVERELQGQIRALEDELELRRKGCPSPTPVENGITEANIAERACPSVDNQCPLQLNTAVNRRQECENRLTLLQQRVGLKENQTHPSSSVQSSPLDRHELMQVREQLSNERKQTEVSRQEQEATLATQKIQAASLAGELEQARELLRRKSDEEACLNQQIATLTEENRKLASKLTAVEEQLTRSKTAAEHIASPSARPSPVALAGLGEASEIDRAAMQAAEAELKRTLSSIQGLVIERKNLYDQVRARQRNISVSIQKLVSRQGLSLDTLRARAASGSLDLNATRAVAQGLREIEAMLKEDIKLLMRIGRL